MRPREQAIAIVLTAALTGCGGQTRLDDESRARAYVPTSPREIIDEERLAEASGLLIAKMARAMLGIAYRYGGDSPVTGFDCSGLVYYSYTENGISVPRTSQDQFRAARKIPLRDATAGDLIFFQDQAKLSHVGIYLGDDLFVHAPSSGREVSIASLSAPYYRRHLVAVGRLLPN